MSVKFCINFFLNEGQGIIFSVNIKTHWELVPVCNYEYSTLLVIKASIFTVTIAALIYLRKEGLFATIIFPLGCEFIISFAI